jgi:hypothetical protein
VEPVVCLLVNTSRGDRRGDLIVFVRWRSQIVQIIENVGVVLSTKSCQDVVES